MRCPRSHRQPIGSVKTIAHEGMIAGPLCFVLCWSVRRLDIRYPALSPISCVPTVRCGTVSPASHAIERDESTAENVMRTVSGDGIIQHPVEPLSAGSAT